jgi:prenyltransferase beta subunit
MKYLGKYLKTTFSRLTSKMVSIDQSRSIEAVLKDGLQLVDTETRKEICSFMVAHQSDKGGFVDRAGNPDLYYTLFGTYLAEALSLTDVQNKTKAYLLDIEENKTLTGIHLSCAVIIHSKLFGNKTLPEHIYKKALHEIKQNEKTQQTYSSFIHLLTLYQLKDVLASYKLIKKIRSLKQDAVMPCTVTAAELILCSLTHRPVEPITKRLLSFNRSNGGFVALERTKIEDLLSTGVALYALNYVKADLRLIKPACLSFIDSLYLDGGFRAMSLDIETDIEYTFYGLLALGSLTN